MSNLFANWKPGDVEMHNAKVAMKTAKQHNVGVVGEVELQPAADETERDLHSQIFNECRRRGWIALHGSMSERTHRNLGEPDFHVLADGGRSFFIEVKTRNGKVSKEQAAFIAHAAKLGHTVSVVRSMREFLEIIK